MKYLGSLWPALALWYEERTALMPFVGREAIYYEKYLIMHVKIARIAFGGPVNSRNMLLELQGLRTHGLPFRQKMICGATLRYMSACYPSVWVGPPYATWTLFFSRKVIDDVKAIVLKVPSGKTFRDGYTLVPVDPASEVAKYAKYTFAPVDPASEVAKVREVQRALMDYMFKASLAERTKGSVPLIRSLNEMPKRKGGVTGHSS